MAVLLRMVLAKHRSGARDLFPVGALAQPQTERQRRLALATSFGSQREGLAGFSPAAAPRLSLQKQAATRRPGLIRQQVSSFRTSFSGLLTTRTAVVKSVIYGRN